MSCVFDSPINDVSILNDRVVIGDVEGSIYINKYDEGEFIKQSKSNLHSTPCRCVEFIPSTDKVSAISAGSLFAVFDCESSAIIYSKSTTHVPHSLKAYSENIILVGDEEGRLEIFDLRQKNLACSDELFSDYISDIHVDARLKALATSGDGTLGAYDIRKGKLICGSETVDVDLISLAVVDDGQKIVCGDSGGDLNFFKWNEFGNLFERYPGHPGGINSIRPLGSSSVVTSCDDGFLRVIRLFPHSVVGAYSVVENNGVDRIAVAGDEVFCCCFNDNVLRIVNIAKWIEKANQIGSGNSKSMSNCKRKRSNFFDDLLKRQE